MTNGRIPLSARGLHARECALVVLGAAVRADGAPTPVLLRRVERAAALMAAGTGDFLVVTGGAIAGRPAESAVMATVARDLGVPADRIVCESKARNTRENARFSLDLLAGRGGVGTVVVITDAWHLPRALMLFRRAAPPGLAVRGCAAPMRAGRLGWWLSALREIPAIAVDVVRARKG